MDSSQDSFEGSDFVNVGTSDNLEGLSLLNHSTAYWTCQYFFWRLTQ